MPGRRFLAAALALGAIALWASENLFWFVPPPDWTLAAFGFTWLLYSAAAAAALAAVMLTGLSGPPAAFLGGATLGYLIEGAAVATMYEAFPFQLVWTPLAWHGLITGGAVLGLGRLAGRFGPWRMALLWLVLGLAAGVWGLWWPIERGAVPGGDALLGYLVVLGLIVPPAHWLLDRLGTLARPRPWVLALAPCAFALSWLVQGALTLNPLRLVLPPILLGLWLIARGLGTQGAPLSFGPPARRGWHHAMFLLMPLAALVVALAGWANIGAVATNWPVALLTVAASIFWLAALAWQAWRRRATPSAP